MDELRAKLQNEWAQAFIDSSETKAILNLAPRTGKIRTTILILKKLGFMNNRILISYPDNKIKKSWEEDFKKWNYNNPLVEFTNFSSLSKHLSEYYDMIIFDEPQDLSEKELNIAASISNTASYTLALSGTISESTKKTLYNFLQIKILIKYGIAEAIRDGIIADYAICIHEVPLDTVNRIKISKGYSTEKQRIDSYTYVIDKLRSNNKSVIHPTLSRNRLLMKAVNRIDMTKRLVKYFEKNNERFMVFTGLQEIADVLGIRSYHSKSKDTTNFDDFLSGAINSLAMVNIGGVGSTYLGLNRIILTNFTYNSERTEQIISRALLLDYASKKAQIDIIMLNEPIERKKITETLKGLDPQKIYYAGNKTEG